MPYRTQSSDTSRAVEERQSAYFRKLGRDGRLKYGSQIVDEGFNALWANLRRDFPGLSPGELRIEWVRRHYGEELANRYEESRAWKNNISDSMSP
jgi:hypothetical protein